MKTANISLARIIPLLGLFFLIGSFQGCLKSSRQTEPNEPVENPDREATLPAVTSIFPKSVRAGESLELLVTGENVGFAQGSATRVIVSLLIDGDTLFSGDADRLYISTSEVKILFGAIPIDAPLGICDVHVRYFAPHASNGDPAGGWIDLNPLSGGFMITSAAEPAIVSVSPASARKGEPLALTITGQDVAFIQDTHAAIRISLVKGSNTIFSATAGYQTSTQTQATVGVNKPMYLSEGAPLGLYDVHASYRRVSPAFPDGEWVELRPLQNAFTVEEYILGGPPRILSVTPDLLLDGVPAEIIVHGENFHSVETVYLAHYMLRGGIRAIPGAIMGPITDSTIRVRIENPEKLAGPVDLSSPDWGVVVRLKNGGPDLILKNSISISERSTLSGVAPSEVKWYGPITLDINCFFRNRPQNLKGWLTRGDHRLDPISVQFISGTLLRMTVLGDSTTPNGAWDLHIETSTEKLFAPRAVTLNMGDPPGEGEANLVSISPRTVNQNGVLNEVQLNLKGSGTWFAQGPFSAWLERESDSIPRTLLGVRSKSSFHAVSDTEAILTFEIPFHTKPGHWDVRFKQPWHTLKLAEAILINPGPAPTLTSPGPYRVHVGMDFTVTVGSSGVHFNQGLNTSVQMRLIHDGDTVSTLQAASATSTDATFKGQASTDWPLGIYQAQVQYFLVTGSLDGQPTGEWVDVPPLVDILDVWKIQ